MMAMAAPLPALKKLGDDLGMSLDAGVSGVTASLADDMPGRESTGD
jgi:hypothetical protein